MKIVPTSSFTATAIILLEICTLFAFKFVFSPTEIALSPTSEIFKFSKLKSEPEKSSPSPRISFM